MSSADGLWWMLGVGAIDFGLRLGSKWAPGHSGSMPLAAPESGAPPLSSLLGGLDALGEILTGQDMVAALQGRSIQVRLSGAWLASATLPWSAELAHATTAERYVRAELASAGFEIGATDVVRIQHARYQEPVLATVYPIALMARLSDIARRIGSRLGSVGPLAPSLWSLVRRSAPDGAEVMAVFEAGAVDVVLASRGRRPSRLASLPVAEADHGEVLGEYWARLCLRESAVSDAQPLHVLDGTGRANPTTLPMNAVAVELAAAPNGGPDPLMLCFAASGEKRLHELDAIQPPKRSGLHVGLIAMAAVAVIAAMFAFIEKGQVQINRQKAAILSPLTDTRGTKPQTLTREELARVKAVNSAITELNLPIPALLRAAQPGPDLAVALLSIEVANTNGAGDSARDPVVKISADASNTRDMTGYVARLSGKASFATAYLRRHETADTALALPYRFTVEGTWRE